MHPTTMSGTVGADPAEREGCAGLAAPTLAGRYRRIARLSDAPWNPYLELLYDALARHGLDVEQDRAPLTVRWLLSARRRVGFLHFHWPQGFYTYSQSRDPVSLLLSWVKLGLFVVRLRVARALGYRLVWTIHQVYPHESPSRRLDRRAGRALSRSCDVLVAHDTWTADAATAELGAEHVEVVPHGSYVGVYPPGRPRRVVRAELGVPDEAFVFLCFGELRGYKDVDHLVDAFRGTALADSVLVVAGHMKDPRTGEHVASAARQDGRIHWVEGFVPPERVAELYAASDVAVVPRRDGGTSGALILALSLDTPLVAADTPTYRGLTLDGRAAWLFDPRDTASLGVTLEQAASSPGLVAEKARSAHEAATRLDWARSAEQLASLLVHVAPR
jgi:glycosyltransferase involved in cell wall biosynthesis